MRFRIRVSAIVALACAVIGGNAHGQTTGKSLISAAVTYVTPGTIYVGAGAAAGLDIGDTLNITHKSSQIGRVCITAISSNSSAAAVLSANPAISLGDSAYVEKVIVRPSKEVAAQTQNAGSQKPRPGPEDNYITGRVALQYAGSGLLVKKMDFSQPSLLLQMNIARLFGTGATFRIYGRTAYDLSSQFAFYGNGGRLSSRIYEMSIVYDDPKSSYGYSAGRILSQYLGGFGVLDGGQAFARTGGLTVGIAGGGLPEPIHSAIDLSHKKGAFFTNFAWGKDVFTRSDVTLAYGQQTYQGKFDRDFLYTQGYIRPAETVSLYHSAEFDLHDLAGNERVSRFHLSNGFLTLTYMPLSWLNVNAGYDATRPIYLFESMKNLPDSLFSRQIQEGIRGGVSIRLPQNILLMENVSYRPTANQRAQTLTSSLRMGNIAASGIDGGVSFTTTKGIYTTGTDLALDFSRWFWQSMGLTARLDRYVYTISGTDLRLRTTTGSLGANAMLSRAVYLMLTYDQVWDSLRNTQRVYFECGMRF